MTLEERVATLETLTQDMRRTVYHDTELRLDIPCMQFVSRVGVFTDYWMHKPWGQGAALSVGTNSDRFAAYFEIDETVCPDHPSVAVYASVVPFSRHGQPHIAFQGAVANAPDAGGISQNYGLHLTFPGRALTIQKEGIQLIGDIVAFYVGKLTGAIKQVWP